MTPSNRALQRGFTLLELMLVMTIMAVLAGAAMLRPPDSDARNLLVTASQLRGFMLAVSADAVRRNETMGIVFQSDAAVVLRHTRDSGWQTTDDSIKALPLPEGTRLEKNRVQRQSMKTRRAGLETIVPDILLLSSGETATFYVQLFHVNASSERYALRSDGLNIELLAL